MNLYFNTEKSVFLLDPTLEGYIWNWDHPTNKTRRVPISSDIIRMSYGTKSDPKISIDIIELGDGYEQVTEVGIRPVKDEFTISFSKVRPAVLRALFRFFRGEGSNSIYNRRPSEYFWMKIPHPWDAVDAKPRKFRCTSIPNEPNTFHAWTMTATLVESFEP